MESNRGIQGRNGGRLSKDFIDQKAPFNLYGKVIKIAVSLFPVAFVLLLFPSYRRLPKEMLTKVIGDEFFPVFLIFFGGLFGLSAWAFSAAQHMPSEASQDVLSLLGLPALLFMMLLAFTSIVWIPIVLLLLPAFVFAIVSLPFKLAYFLLVAGVKAPIIIWHSCTTCLCRIRRRRHTMREWQGRCRLPSSLPTLPMPCISMT